MLARFTELYRALLCSATDATYNRAVNAVFARLKRPCRGEVKDGSESDFGRMIRPINRPHGKGIIRLDTSHLSVLYAAFLIAQGSMILTSTRYLATAALFQFLRSFKDGTGFTNEEGP